MDRQVLLHYLLRYPEIVEKIYPQRGKKIAFLVDRLKKTNITKLMQIYNNPLIPKPGKYKLFLKIGYKRLKGNRITNENERTMSDKDAMGFLMYLQTHNYQYYHGIYSNWGERDDISYGKNTKILAEKKIINDFDTFPSYLNTLTDINSELNHDPSAKWQNYVPTNNSIIMIDEAEQLNFEITGEKYLEFKEKIDIYKDETPHPILTALFQSDIPTVISTPPTDLWPVGRHNVVGSKYLHLTWDGFAFCSKFDRNSNPDEKEFTSITSVSYTAIPMMRPEEVKIILNELPMFGAVLQYDAIKHIPKDNRKCVVEYLSNTYNITERTLIKHFGLNDITDGISGSQLKAWCKNNSISYYCLDLIDQFYDIYKCDSSKRALIYVYANSHLYPIDDEQKRNKIIRKAKFYKLNKEKEANEYRLNSKAKKCKCHVKDCKFNGTMQEVRRHVMVQHRTPRIGMHLTVQQTEEYLLDINNKNADIFLTDRAEIIKLLKFYCKHLKYVPTPIYKGKLAAMLDDSTRNIIIHKKPDDPTEHICTALNIKYNEQTIPALAREYFDEHVGRYKSTLNADLIEIFENTAKNTVAFVRQFEQPLSGQNKFVSFDMIKCYTSQMCEFAFPIYQSLNHVEKFIKIEHPGFYYVQTDNNFPFRGNNFYDSYLVAYGINEEIITKEQILYSLLPHNKTNEWKSHIKNIYDKVDPSEAKLLCNSFYGSLRCKTTSTVKKNIVTQSFIEAAYYMNLQNSFAEQLCNEKEDGMNVYRVLHYDNYLQETTGLPIYISIMHRAYVGMHKLYKRLINVGYKPLKIETDNIVCAEIDKITPGTYSHALNLIEESKTNFEKIGLYRVAYVENPFRHTTDSINPYNYELAPQINETLNLSENEDLNIGFLVDERIKQHKGFLVNGSAGTGKSHIIKKLSEKLIEEKISYTIIAYTNTAADNVGGLTCHNLLKMDSSDEKGSGVKLEAYLRAMNTNRVLIIDEISMVPESIYRYLMFMRRMNPSICLCFFGDFKQLQPIESEFNQVVSSYDYENNPIIKNLHDNFTINLKKNYRSSGYYNKLLEQLYENNFKNHKQLYSIIPIRRSFDIKINICWRNIHRKKVNRQYMIYHSNGINKKLIKYKNIEEDTLFQDVYLYEGLPLIACKTFFIGEEKINNSEHFIVTKVATEDGDIYFDIKNNASLNKKERIFMDFNSDMLFSHFVVGYAFTTHKAQGLTINEKYQIHEFNLMAQNKRLAYTALSRATDPKNINIILETCNNDPIEPLL